MRVNFEFDNADEFHAMFSRPAQDLAHAEARAEKAWDAYHDQQTKIAALVRENYDLKDRVPSSPTFTGSITETDLRNLLIATVAGNKIAAIKAIRALLGLGLKESKDLVEQCGVQSYYRPNV